MDFNNAWMEHCGHRDNRQGEAEAQAEWNSTKRTPGLEIVAGRRAFQEDVEIVGQIIGGRRPDCASGVASVLRLSLSSVLI
jgi:hypothetical protein